MLSRKFVQPKFVLIWTHPSEVTKPHGSHEQFTAKKMEVEEWPIEKKFGLHLALSDDECINNNDFSLSFVG